MNRFIKVLIYGQPGAGKTRFAAGAPKPKFYDFENSTTTLEYVPELVWIIEQNRVVRYPDPLELFNSIRKDVRDPEVETIVIDSFTTAVDTYLQDYMEKQGRKDEFTRYDSDYGPATNLFTKLFTRLQRASINVILVGHERFDRSNDREQTVTRIYPYVTPALRSAVTRLVDFAGYLEIQPGTQNRAATRRMYCNPTHLIEAKNRLNIQELYLENPTWDTIFGKKEEENE